MFSVWYSPYCATPNCSTHTPSNTYNNKSSAHTTSPIPTDRDEKAGRYSLEVLLESGFDLCRKLVYGEDDLLVSPLEALMSSLPA
jgi:hypothetical protein